MLKTIQLFCTVSVLLCFNSYADAQQSSWKATAALNQKWGIIDDKGNWILEPKYEELRDTEDDTYIFKNTSKYGLLDLEGNMILPAEYDELSYNSKGYYNARKNNGFGIIDLKGNWVLAPKPEYRSFGELKDNIVSVTDVSFNTGIINTKGEWITKYKQGESGSAAALGLIVVKNSNQKYGYKKTSSQNWNIQPAFEAAENFIPSIELAQVKFNGKFGFIDKSGKWVLKPNYDVIQSVGGTNHLVYCEDRTKTQCGIYNLQTKTWLNASMPLLGYLSFNKAGNFIRIRSKAAVYGDVNDNVIEAYCENKPGSPADYAKIRLSAREGLLDMSGKWIIEPQKYYRLREINDDLFIVQFNDKLEKSANDFKYGIINTKGEWVVMPEYDNISFEIKFCIMQKDKKFGIIDLEGKIVAEATYDKIYTLETINEPGLAKYKLQDKWGVIDGKGVVITPAMLDDAAAFKEQLILAKKDLRWGVIDHDGKWIIQPEFDEIGY